MTQRKYQFFISSTYTDLVEARQTVAASLLQQGHFPVGLELYPTEENDIWSVIQQQIAECDYYVVLVGGRYGSLSPIGLSYTHREYIYASTRRKPVLALIHDQPHLLADHQRETTRAGQMQLEDFRKLVAKGQMVREWHTLAELRDLARTVVPQFVSRFPCEGWIRGNTQEDERQVEQLKQQVAKLEQELQDARHGGRQPSGPFPSDLRATVRYQGSVYVRGDCKLMDITSQPTWGQLFTSLAPHLLAETDEDRMREVLEEFLSGQALADAQLLLPKAHAVRNVRLSTESFNQIKVRLRALGVINKSTLRDASGGTLWRLTLHGDQLMTRLLARPAAATGL